MSNIIILNGIEVQLPIAVHFKSGERGHLIEAPTGFCQFMCIQIEDSDRAFMVNINRSHDWEIEEHLLSCYIWN